MDIWVGASLSAVAVTRQESQGRDGVQLVVLWGVIWEDEKCRWDTFCVGRFAGKYFSSQFETVHADRKISFAVVLVAVLID